MLGLPVKPIDTPKTCLATRGFDPEIHVGKAFAEQAGGPDAWMVERARDWLEEYRME